MALSPLAATLATAPGAGVFVSRYCALVHEAARTIDPATIEALVDELIAAHREDAMIWVAANGGSALSAAHLALGLGTYLAQQHGVGFRIQALTTNPGNLTGIPNDRSFLHVFADQLDVVARPGDRLIVLSCSGASHNLIAAAGVVRGRGGRVLALTGFDGGHLRTLADLTLHVGAGVDPRRTPGMEPAPDEYGLVEDVHMQVVHALVNWFGQHPPTAPGGRHP